MKRNFRKVEKIGLKHYNNIYLKKNNNVIKY